MDIEKLMNAEMSDSGERQTFSSGAIRDSATDKPRVDLFSIHMYRDIIAREFSDYSLCYDLWVAFKQHVNKSSLMLLFIECCKAEEISIANAIQDVSYWLMLGARKYTDNNWMLGIPISRVVQSADRHFLSWMNNEQDEKHLSAFLCNVMFIYHYLCENEQGKLPDGIIDKKSYL